jgi:hypothetical protein
MLAILYYDILVFSIQGKTPTESTTIEVPEQLIHQQLIHHRLPNFERCLREDPRKSTEAAVLSLAESESDDASSSEARTQSATCMQTERSDIPIQSVGDVLLS